MRFFTVFTVLAASAMAFAGVIPDFVAKRDVAGVQNAMTTLSNQCDTILPKFDNCGDDDCTTTIVLELDAAINGCKNTLGGVNGGPGTPEFATVVANLVTKIADKLEDHKNKCGGGCPNIVGIYAQVDASLSACLSACFNLCAGLASLVSALLVGLSATLHDLVLTSVVSVCLL